MAFRTWAKLLGATLGVAALAGASQLGVAYGLGVLRLTRVLDTAARDQWIAQLAWVAWLAMMAAVLGGLAGGRLRNRRRAQMGPITAIGLSVAAGVGAAIVVPLTMQPARAAQVVGVHAVFVIGLCAVLGALAGAIAAYAALTRLVARWNLGLFGLIVWVIALVSVSSSLASGEPSPMVRLGVFDAGFLSPGLAQRTALFTMPAVALIVGAALGWAARRREMPTLTIALAGLPGPALLTVSYLIAGPGSGSERYQVVPYWAAMTATGAGVLGSVLAAVLRRGEPREENAEASQAGGAPASTGTSASGVSSPSTGGPPPAGAPMSIGAPPTASHERATEFPATEPPGGGIPDQRPGGEGGRRAGAVAAFASRSISGLRDRMPFGRKRSGGAPDVEEGAPSVEAAWPGRNPLGRAPADHGQQPEGSSDPRAGGVTETEGRTWRRRTAPQPEDHTPHSHGGPEGLDPRGYSVSEPAGRTPRGFRPPFARPQRRSAPPGRGPLVPEPEAISPPLSQPGPINPPLPLTPAPQAPARQAPAPHAPARQASARQAQASKPQAQPSGPQFQAPGTQFQAPGTQFQAPGPQAHAPAPQPRAPMAPEPDGGRRGRRRRTEAEFVSWVNSLGGQTGQKPD